MAAPGPVPALPDTERRTQYVITASTGPLNVGFALYGDGTDFVDWIQVYVNNAVTTAYRLTSPSGSISTLPRPITDAQITLNAAQTGTVQIVGARRPRRTSQLNENRGVAARDANQIVTDLTAQLREAWDWRNRVIQGVPGDSFAPLVPATRANSILGFDGSGDLALLPLGPTISFTAGSVFNTRGLAAAATISGTVAFIQTAGFAAVGDRGAATYIRTGASTPGGFQSVDGSWWAITDTVLWAKQFGAAENGIASDEVALQALIDRAVALGVPARFAGHCVLSAGLTITNFVDFGGIGLSGGSDITDVVGGSRLLPALNITAISVNTNDPVNLHDFAIAYPGQCSIGAAILLTAPDQNVNTRIDNISVYYAFVAFKTLRAAIWNIGRCHIWSASIGLWVENDFHADAGDSTMHDCNMTLAQTAGVYGVFYVSSGGLRLTDNKINGGQIGLNMQFAAGAVTADLIVTGGSFENQATNFFFQRAGTTGSFQNVTISGVQAGGYQASGGVFLQIPTDASGVWMKSVTAMGNVIDGLAGGTGFMIDVDSVDGFTFMNTIRSNGGTWGRHRLKSAASNGVAALSGGGGSFAASQDAGTNNTKVAPW